MKPISLYERGNLFSIAFPKAAPLSYHDGMLSGFWFLGGGRHSEFYGAYHCNYLNRISSIFPDAEKVLHLFSGALPPSPKYARFGMGEGEKPDIVGNAEQLSSILKFRPDLIYADPPYSTEDAEHYKTGLVNRSRVIKECAVVLQSGGFLVWLDQILPVFDNKDLNLVGLIGYIRSTSNRFRCISIFRKP